MLNPIQVTQFKKDVRLSIKRGKDMSKLKKQITNLLLQGLIEMTIPETPKSRLQKYRLTNTSRDLIDMI